MLYIFLCSTMCRLSFLCSITFCATFCIVQHLYVPYLCMPCMFYNLCGCTFPDVSFVVFSSHVELYFTPVYSFVLLRTPSVILPIIAMVASGLLSGQHGVNRHQLVAMIHLVFFTGLFIRLHSWEHVFLSILLLFHDFTDSP